MKIKSMLFLIITILFQLSCTDSNNENSMKMKIGINDSTRILMQKAVSVKPHTRQYEWQTNEYIAFIHFGVNTFTGREWGTGFEDPKIFNPKKMDTDQWCNAMKASGMKMVILTAKHHDGFCLWQTRYNTKHSVVSSGWRDGKGDVMKDLSASCEKYGLKLGVYLSPADLYQIENSNGLYGNGSKYSERIIPRPVDGKPFNDKRSFKYNVDDYNEYFMNQLFELLTEYGPIHEVWFDGAHPKRKGGQTYTYNLWYELIRELAPEAVIFGKGPDVRWCGNEAGRTRKAEWSVIPFGGTPENCTWPDLMDDDIASLNKIKAKMDIGGFLQWYPAETNTSIRHGWFWLDEAQYVKSVEEILDIWYRSIGGNSVFLLNIPPNRDGLFSERDVAVLENVGKLLNKTFKTNLVEGAEIEASSSRDNEHSAKNIVDENPNSCWMPNEWELQSELEITLSEEKTFNRIVLQEHIQKYSQRISSFAIDAFVDDEWREISEGTTVGYKRICRTSSITSDKLRIRILDARVCPTISNFGLYYEPVRVSNPVITRNKDGNVSINCIPPGPIIRYTLNGSEPDIHSDVFTETIFLPYGGIVKALAFHPVEEVNSEISTAQFDICSVKWKIHKVSSEQADNLEQGSKAIDGDENTNWITRWTPDSPKHPHFISIDLGEELNLKGFTYTPRKGKTINGTIKAYSFSISLDGKNWEEVIGGKFDNIKNNPVKQSINFGKTVKAKFIKLIALSEVNGNPWASVGEIGIITK